MTEKENHLPNLSSEERAHALELAIQARRRYAALKARKKWMEAVAVCNSN